MAITRTAMVDDDGSGTTGTILNNAWKSEFYNQIDAADVALAGTIGGSWTNIPYAAGNFTAAGAMIWTVEAADVSTLAYTVIGGHTAIVAVGINSSTLSGTASTDCYIALPAGLTPAVTAQAVGRCGGVTPFVPLLLYVLAGQARIGLQRLDSINHVLATNLYLFQGTIVFQV